MTATSPLLQPYRLGNLELPNRVVITPLTRSRVTHNTNAPNKLVAEYYRQRASAGLIISEASQISQQGQGYIWSPGIYTREQIDGWRKVTDAVHGAGGKSSFRFCMSDAFRMWRCSPAARRRCRLRPSPRNQRPYWNPVSWTCPRRAR